MIDQYTPSANTAETSGLLKMTFSYISRPLVLQIRFSKTYLGEIKHIPIWQVVPMGAFFDHMFRMAFSGLSGTIFGSTAL